MRDVSGVLTNQSKKESESENKKEKNNKKNSHLVWMDLEMTGLDPESGDRIIEIAVIITDSDLNIIATGPVLAIHQEKSLLDKMDAWNTKTHGGSGLVQRVLDSTISEQDAERQILNFIKKYVKKNQSPLCGNSIWQDRRFLAKYMPKLEQYLHYRLIDVSTIKELAKRWAPKIYSDYEKESKHQALADIQASIDELKYYRAAFLKNPI